MPGISLTRLRFSSFLLSISAPFCSGVSSFFNIISSFTARLCHEPEKTKNLPESFRYDFFGGSRALFVAGRQRVAKAKMMKK
jgi:hypothetical protein